MARGRGGIAVVLLVGLVGVLLTGLLAPPSAAAGVGAIVGGEPADSSASGFVAHLSIARTATTTFTCSGTLVAPRLVLTAAHCLDSTRPADFAVTFPDGERRGAVAVVPYTAESGVREGAPVDDLAVVQLDRPADATPLALPADPGTAAVTATPVLELGYGATSPGGAPSPEGELRRAGQVLTGTPTGSGRGALLLQGVPQGLGGIPGGSCAAGDSGGPLVAVASPPVLLGVVSSAVAGTNACWSSRVDAGPYRTWLDGVMAQPGARFGDAATEAAQAEGQSTAGTPGTAPSALPSGASTAAGAPPLPAVLAPLPQPAPAAPGGLTAAELGPLADTAPGRLAAGTAVTTPPPPVGPAPVVVYTR